MNKQTEATIVLRGTDLNGIKAAKVEDSSIF
jgi:hypothetical protein